MVTLNYNKTEMSNAFIGYIYEQTLINFTKNLQKKSYSYNEKPFIEIIE